MSKSSSRAVAPVRTFGVTDLALAAMSLIWGLNFIVVKTTLREISPFAFVAARFFIAGLLFFLIVRMRRGGWQIPRREWGKFALLGIIGTTLYQPLFINGLALTKASNSALILAATPAFIALLNRLIGRERLAARGWFGIGLSFVGIALIVQSGENLLLNPLALLGDLLVLGATVCWSVYSVLTAPLLQRYSALAVTALSTILGAIPLILLSAPALAAQNWATVSATGWSGLLYSAVLAIVVAYLIWNHGVKRIGGARTAIYNNLTPVIATLAAALFLDEPLSPLKLVGAAVIFVGLYLARTSGLLLEPEA